MGPCEDGRCGSDLRIELTNDPGMGLHFKSNGGQDNAADGMSVTWRSEKRGRVMG